MFSQDEEEETLQRKPRLIPFLNLKNFLQVSCIFMENNLSIWTHQDLEIKIDLVEADCNDQLSNYQLK